MFNKLKGLLPVAAGAAAGIALAAVPAHATTADCLSALGNQCDTFTGQDAAAHTVYWDNRGQVKAPGAVIIGYSANSTSDPATDFTKVQHIGKVPGLGLSDQNTITYSFVYTPRGAWTSLCIADPNAGDNHLVLRSCNGLQWQRFVAQNTLAQGVPNQVNPAGSGFNGQAVPSFGHSTFAFQNVASRKWVTDAGTGSPGAPSSPDTRQLVDAAPSSTVTAGTFGANQVWSRAS